MAMEKDPSSRPPFVVLGDIVQDFAHEYHRGAFRIVKCRRREAYGCGQNGDAVVRGLTLLVRLGGEDDPRHSPKLCLSATDEVLQRVASEMDESKTKIHGMDLHHSCRVYTVDGNVMVLCLSFVANFNPGVFRSYYLVYDSAAESLTMLSRRPPICRHICTTRPLKVGGGDDGKYSLVLMAEERPISSAGLPTPVLCLWSPNKRRDYSRCPWDVKHRREQQQQSGFNAEHFQAKEVFVFKGNAVWADVAKGILYCDCSDLIDGAKPAVGFKHIMLPAECMIWGELGYSDEQSMRLHRSMGRVGDSIWFVIIQPNLACPGDTVVKVWTLDDLLSEEEDEKQWNPHREFKMQDLFRAAGFLPKTVPKLPILRQQDDGALYMLLLEPHKGGNAYGHLACIDLSSSSSCVVRLRSSRRLVIPLMDYPIVLDPNFFATRPFEEAQVLLS